MRFALVLSIVVLTSSSDAWEECTGEHCATEERFVQYQCAASAVSDNAVMIQVSGDMPQQHALVEAEIRVFRAAYASKVEILSSSSASVPVDPCTLFPRTEMSVTFVRGGATLGSCDCMLEIGRLQLAALRRLACMQGVQDDQAVQNGTFRPLALPWQQNIEGRMLRGWPKNGQMIVTDNEFPMFVQMGSTIPEDQDTEFAVHVHMMGYDEPLDRGRLTPAASIRVGGFTFPPGTYSYTAVFTNTKDRSDVFGEEVVYSIASPVQAARLRGQVIAYTLDQVNFPCRPPKCWPENVFRHISANEGSTYIQFNRIYEQNPVVDPADKEGMERSASSNNGDKNDNNSNNNNNNNGGAAERGVDTVFVYDNALHHVHNFHARRKVALIVESPSMVEKVTDMMLYSDSIIFGFHWVISCDKRVLIRANGRGLFGTCGWAQHCHPGYPPSLWKMWPKHHMVSMIASIMNDTIGHKMRQRSWDTVANGTFGGHQVTRFGWGFRTVDNTLEALHDHRYSIVVENNNMDYYFTDKLLLCFATGTVPIFWGFPSVTQFFDARGIITFQDASELPDILSKLSVEDYESRRPAMLRNMEAAKMYWSWEDFLYLHHTWLFEQPPVGQDTGGGGGGGGGGSGGGDGDDDDSNNNSGSSSADAVWKPTPWWETVAELSIGEDVG